MVSPQMSLHYFITLDENYVIIFITEFSSMYFSKIYLYDTNIITNKFPPKIMTHVHEK